MGLTLPSPTGAEAVRLARWVIGLSARGEGIGEWATVEDLEKEEMGRPGYWVATKGRATGRRKEI
jgi:hypothetical protein